MGISWGSRPTTCKQTICERPALVELAGGVQEARSRADAHGHAVLDRAARTRAASTCAASWAPGSPKTWRARWSPAARRAAGRRAASRRRSSAALGEHLVGGRLGRRDVGLVERLHADGGTGERGGELGDHDEPSEASGGRRQPAGRPTGWPRDAARRFGRARPGRRRTAGRRRRRRARQDLAHDRDDAGAVLAEDSATSCSSQRPSGGHLGREDERGPCRGPPAPPRRARPRGASAGLPAGSASGPALRERIEAASQQAPASTPARRAGTMPNSESAE